MNPDDTAYLIYLGLLLLFIGGIYFLSNRDGLSKQLQQIALWILIFFGFLAAYALKDPVTQALYPSRALESGDAITFKKADDGHFYVTLDINDTPIEFVLDTGASQIVLTPSDARKLGFDPDQLNYIDRVYTANGIAGSARVTLNRVDVGSVTDFNVRAAVNQTEIFSSLLGMTYLSKFGEIRIRGNTLYLVR